MQQLNLSEISEIIKGEIENHIRVGYGSYDTQQQALDSGGSLTDTLRFRLLRSRPPPMTPRVMTSSVCCR